MKAINVFLVLVIFLGACSSPKKTTAKKNSTPKISRADILKGGTSFDNAIVIRVEKEGAGVAEEFKWLGQSYPGYSMIRKTQTSRGNKRYDIIKIKTKNGGKKKFILTPPVFMENGKQPELLHRSFV